MCRFPFPAKREGSSSSHCGHVAVGGQTLLEKPEIWICMGDFLYLNIDNKFKVFKESQHRTKDACLCMDKAPGSGPFPVLDSRGRAVST